MKRQIAKALLLGAGLGITGCQAPSLGGLAFWKSNSSSAASTAPDVGKQKYSGLASQFGGGDPHRAMGSSPAGSTALGQARPEPDNFFMASWKKTSAAVGGALAVKPKVEIPEDDPVSLDRMPKRIGPEVYVSAARLLENQGKFVEAEEKYREALRAAPTDLNSLVGLARLYDRQGQSAKALDTYLKAAQIYPAEALIQNDLGLCLRRQRDLDKSLAALQKAVQLAPDNAKYRNNLAAALVDAGRTEEAFKQLAAHNPPAVAHYNLAHLLEQKSQRDKAVHHLRQAVALDANLTAARDLLVQFTGTAGSELSWPAGSVNAPQSPSAVSASSIKASPAPVAQAPAVEPPSYHVGDDSSPAATLAGRPIWNSPASPTVRPLPPID